MTDDRPRSSPPGIDSTVASADPAAVDRAPTLVGVGVGQLVPRSVETSPEASDSGSSGATTKRPIGMDMRSASIERFGRVTRDRFELLGELARGGLGRVFRARDPRTGRIVAIKEVLRNAPEITLRFAREAMVTANLQHPSIVPVYEVGRWDDGEPYYAMKLVDGRTLDALISNARSLEARIALVPHVIAVADALAYAHGEHVIHRDLKPANVLIGPYGETVVIDWGLAKNTATGEEIEELVNASTIPPDGGETVAGSVLGTPAYMAPEQALGGHVDERADVYAIGAILYTTLAGERPYAEHRTLDELLAAVRGLGPRRLATVIPPALVAIVETAMARDPANRYPSAAELAADLRRFQAGQLVGAHHYTTGERIRHWVAKHRGTVITAAIAFVVVVVLGAIGVARIASERDDANRQRELAERRYADSIEELGRQALIAHTPERALAIVAAAATARGEITRRLGVLGAQVRAEYAGLVGMAPGLEPNDFFGDLAPDGVRAVTATGAGVVHVWDFATGAELWRGSDARHVSIARDVVICADHGAVVARSLATGQQTARWTIPQLASDETIIGLSVAPDGVHFALGSSMMRLFVGAIGEAPLHAVADHPSTLAAIALAPSGRAVAFAGPEGVFVADTATGAPIAHLAGAAAVTTVTWVDDERLIVGDAATDVSLWHVGAPHAEPRPRFGAQINGFAANAADGWAVTIGLGDTAVVWALDTGAVRARLPGHRESSYYATVAGHLLVTADEEGSVFVWDPQTGERLQSIPVDGVAWGIVARGDHLFVFGEARARLYRFAPDAEIRRLAIHTGRVRDLHFSGDDARLWTASNDGSARGTSLAGAPPIILGTGGFTEPPLLEVTDRRDPNPHGIRAATQSPDGTRIATASDDGSAIVWDAIRGTETARLVGHTTRVSRVVFARDGATAFSVGDTTLRRWDPASGRALGQATIADGALDLAVVSDVTVATMSTNKRLLGLWNAKTLAPIATAATVTRLRDLPVVDGRVLVASEAQLAFVDASGVISHVTPTSSVLVAAVHAPSWIAAGNARGEVSLHDAHTLELVRTWRAAEAPIMTMAFSPDGAILATTAGKNVRLWDPATGALLGETRDVSALVFYLAWSHDGTRLAFAGGTGTVWLWNLAAPTAIELVNLARCASPWRLADAALVAHPFEPDACRAVLGDGIH